MFEWGFNGFLDSLLAPLQDWVSQYPQLGWLLTHPGWLGVAIVVALFLLAGLLRAVANLTEKLWLTLLTLPIRLVQWVWQGSLFLMRRPFAGTVVQSSLLKRPAQLPERLTQVLDRLEVLRQEQDELLQEVKSLLVEKSLNE